MRAATGIAAAALLLVGTTARAEVIDIAWSDAGRFERSVEVAPGKFAEACGALARGAAVRWEYDAAAPLDFNVHYHVGKDDVVYPEKRDASRRASGTLRVTRAEDYCWMWTNRGERPVALRFALAR